MLVKLAIEAGIVPICTVRRVEQIEILKEIGAQYVLNSSNDDYKQLMTEACTTLTPTVCLECIGGDTVGEMLQFMGLNATCIVYGLLSEQPAGNISIYRFLGLNQTLESFFLPHYLAKVPIEKRKEFATQSELLCTSTLKTHVNARFGFHQIKEALEFYHANQTAGKVLLKVALT